MQKYILLCLLILCPFVHSQNYREIVVLVPGIMGSRLSDEVGEVWPGSTWKLVTGFDDASFKRLRDPDNLTPTGVIESFYFEQYSGIINFFTKKINPNFVRIQTPDIFPSDKKNCLLVFSYDWRKDNRITARLFADYIDKIVKTAENHGEKVNITLLCHSMGGLIARYYLESEALAPKKGLEKIKRIIFMGTPHHGAPLALYRILGKEGTLWLKKKHVKELGEDTRFPSSYQLLPDESLPFLISKKDAENINIYDENVYSKLGLSKANIENAYKFHKELNYEKLIKSNIKTFCFFGSHHKTLTTFFYQSQENSAQITIKETSPSGDGTVPVLSAWLNGSPNLAVENEHGTIYSSINLKRLLPSLLNLGIAESASSEEGISLHLTKNILNQNDKLEGILQIQEDIALNAEKWSLTITVFLLTDSQSELPLTDIKFLYITNQLNQQEIKTFPSIEVSNSPASTIPFSFDLINFKYGNYLLTYKTGWKQDIKKAEIGDFGNFGETRFVIIPE